MAGGRMDGRIDRSIGGITGGMIDRKRFLQAAGLGLLAGCAGERGSRGGEGAGAGGGGAAGAAAGGGSPTVTEADDAAGRALAPPLERIGVQLYTVRSLMAEDVAATLDRVAAIGYGEVEFAGYFGHAPGEIRGWLDAAGMTAPAAHVGIPELTAPQLDATVEAALAVGHEWLVLPFVGAEMRTADGYREVARVLNAAGAAAASAGVRIGYHNHAFEFDTVEDGADARTGLSLLLEHCDPDLVDFEIDVHWSTVAGVDALALFAEHPGRFPLCHVKDMTADGAMADVGAGVIDWAGLFARSEQAGLRHYFVEHDQPADPLASVEASYRYLAGM